MSIATEITRIQTARNTLRTKAVALGIGGSTDKLDTLATEYDSIVNRGAVSATVQEGDTYTIPAGYHNGSGTVSGVSGGGNYTLQSKTVTPTTSQQSVTADSGYYGLSGVTVNAIPSSYADVSSVTAEAGDVVSPKLFVDDEGALTAGTMPNNGAVSAALDTSTTSYTVPAGYHNGSGTVSITTETKSVNPSTSSQTVAPTNGRVLSSVTVAAMPTPVAEPSVELSFSTNQYGVISYTAGVDVPEGYYPITYFQSSKPIDRKYCDTTGDDAVAANILYGKKAHSNSSGTSVALTGTMPNNGAITATIDGLTTTSYTVPAGYHSGSGTVSLTNDIETALAAI